MYDLLDEFLGLEAEIHAEIDDSERSTAYALTAYPPDQQRSITDRLRDVGL